MSDKVQILLSLYKPNLEFLTQQLQSIDQQDYSPIELLVYDDGPIEDKVDREIILSSISNITVRFLPSENKNLGYIKAFEKLIKNSDGKYLCFCDQDDIWESNKISESLKALKKTKALLAVSDRKIINSKDQVVVDSVHHTSKKYYENWKNGDDICSQNLFVCFAPGMSMVVDGSFARSVLPISIYTGHDKWILACVSAENKVVYIDQTLVRYRRHGNNVSGVLTDINSKQDYYLNRIKQREGLLNDFFSIYPNYKDREKIMEFMYAQKNHNILKIWKNRNFAPDIAIFDIMLSVTPDFLFKMALRFIKRKKKEE